MKNKVNMIMQSDNPFSSSTKQIVIQSLLVLLFLLSPVFSYFSAPLFMKYPGYYFLIAMYLARFLDVLTALKIHLHPMWKLVKPKAFDVILQKFGYWKTQIIFLIGLLIPFFFMSHTAQVNFYSTLMFLFLAIAINNAYTIFSLNKLQVKYEETIPLPPFYGWVFQALWVQSERQESRHPDFYSEP